MDAELEAKSVCSTPHPFISYVHPQLYQHPQSEVHRVLGKTSQKGYVLMVKKQNISVSGLFFKITAHFDAKSGQINKYYYETSAMWKAWS
jgi:hypothetical protein